MNQIERFINQLARQKVPDISNNIYRGKSALTEKRKHNLKVYLNMMLDADPKILLLGEAPGYKGCGITGVPFSSEQLIFETNFFKGKGFQLLNNSDSLEKENSAKFVWNELSNYDQKPLIWNIYPFHPFQKGNKKSNRKPNAEELEIGEKILQKLLSIFSIEKILAVGRVPESRMHKLAVESIYVRHPSYGGKQDFIRGIREHLK